MFEPKKIQDRLIECKRYLIEAQLEYKNFIEEITTSNKFSGVYVKNGIIVNSLIQNMAHFIFSIEKNLNYRILNKHYITIDIGKYLYINVMYSFKHTLHDLILEYISVYEPIDYIVTSCTHTFMITDNIEKFKEILKENEIYKSNIEGS